MVMCVKGGVYSNEKCPICGEAMKDNGRDGVICQSPEHPKKILKATTFFVKFPPSVFRRFSSYEEAAYFLAGLRFEFSKGTYDERDWKKANPLGFANLTEKYLEVKRETVKPGSYTHIKRDIGTAATYFGETNIKEIGYGEIEDFLLSRKGISGKTRHNVKTNLHAFFVWLTRRRVLRKDQMPDFPELSFELGFRKTVDKPTQDAILEEVRKLTLGNPRIYLGIKWLCTYVSIRPGELRGILEEDIDLSRGILTIRDHKTVSSKGPKFVPLLEEDIESVKLLPKGFPKTKFFRRDRGGGGRSAGSPLGKHVLYDYWIRACNSLGISGVDLYGGCRHSTMQYLRSLGKSKEDVKVLSDHSTNKALDRYLEKNFDEMREGYALTRGPARVIRMERKEEK